MSLKPYTVWFLVIITSYYCTVSLSSVLFDSSSLMFLLFLLVCNSSPLFLFKTMFTTLCRNLTSSSKQALFSTSSSMFNVSSSFFPFYLVFPSFFAFFVTWIPFLLLWLLPILLFQHSLSTFLLATVLGCDYNVGFYPWSCWWDRTTFISFVQIEPLCQQLEPF